MPAQYRALWSTPGGGNGFTVLHFGDCSSSGQATAIAGWVHTFFDALKGLFPNEVTFSFDDEVLQLDDAGTLTAVFAVTPPAAVVGINASTYNRAAGVRVDWQTGVIVAGHRLTGRTFLVPTTADVFDSNGLITSANQTVIATHAANLITNSSASNPLMVWSRAHATHSAVITASVPPKGAILRGRRD